MIIQKDLINNLSVKNIDSPVQSTKTLLPIPEGVSIKQSFKKGCPQSKEAEEFEGVMSIG